YEETSRDFERLSKAITEALRRFHTGVIAAWYPIKDARETAAWQASLAHGLDCEALAAELWLYPRDSRVALNGSGMLIVNPPYLLAERMRVWLPELHARLDLAGTGGTSIRSLTPEEAPLSTFHEYTCNRRDGPIWSSRPPGRPQLVALHPRFLRP